MTTSRTFVVSFFVDGAKQTVSIQARSLAQAIAALRALHAGISITIQGGAQ
jgi:hypothetical protein